MRKMALHENIPGPKYAAYMVLNMNHEIKFDLKKIGRIMESDLKMI